MAGENFVLDFEREGKRALVTGLGPEGIILSGETDAWPLGVALRLEPVSVGTRFRFETIQRNRGWIGRHTFPLNMSLDQGGLKVEGVESDLLPEGVYRAAVVVSGYRFHSRILEFTVPKNGSVRVTVKDQPEKRRVELTETVDRFDDLTRGIVERSALDGRPLKDWLEDPAQRGARKACVLNLLAKLRTPIQSNEPLSRGVQRVMFADVDRVYAELEPAYSRRFLAGGAGFTQDSVVHTTHLRLLTKIPNGNRYRIESLREAVAQNSMHLALGLPDDTALAEYVDMDIDLGNPFSSPLGFFIHLGELIDPGKTDHIALRKSLGGSIGTDFLYYEVKEV